MKKSPRKRQARASKRAPPQPALFTLPAMLDIQHVAEIAARLRERIAHCAAVQIDGSGVANADTAGLQLLIAARRAACARSISFEWCGLSPALRTTSGTLGLCDALGIAGG